MPEYLVDVTVTLRVEADTEDDITTAVDELVDWIPGFHVENYFWTDYTTA